MGGGWGQGVPIPQRGAWTPCSIYLREHHGASFAEWGKHLPGHNHPPWCPCGWCHKPSSGGYARPPAPSRRLNSSDLPAYGVSEIRSAACFVSPNATCPVCGERVYYYQNGYGSKVYFDDLGWPWPKHPCVDTQQETRNNWHVLAATFPNNRIDQYISDNLLRVSCELNIAFKRTLVSHEWRLGILLNVDTFDNHTDASIEFLEEERPMGRFLYGETSPFLKKDSIISYSGDLISLPSANTLEPVTFRVKWRR